MTNIMDPRQALRAIFGSADKVTTSFKFGGIDLTESSTIKEEIGLTSANAEARVKMFVF